MATTTLLAQSSITFSSSTILPNLLRKKHPVSSSSFSITTNSSAIRVPSCCKLSVYDEQSCKGRVFRGGVLVGRNGLMRDCKRRVVLVRSNNLGFGFNGGGGGGNGGGDDDGTGRMVGNLALAIGLTYLTLSGQLGWILDTIVSIGLALIVVPVVGVVAFLWWASRDIVQGACPNCGNDFQLFKSALNDESQPCPYCGEPFSVVGDEFVSDSMNFGNQATTFGQAFDELFPRSNKGSKKEKKYSKAIVDIEAEVKDVD